LDNYMGVKTGTDIGWFGLYHLNFAQKIKSKRVLELGSGTGQHALVMAALGATVVAVDISTQSEKIINEAKVALRLQNIEALTGDFASLPFELGSFDVVVGKAILHHLDHEIERTYLAKTAMILKPEGEAWFFETAVNSRTLDVIRYLIPVPGRPSCLNRQAFRAWEAEDPHPHRDNSSAHFLKLGQEFFGEVKIIPLGCVERFNRLIPWRSWQRAFRRFTLRFEAWLPFVLRYKLARSQLIILRHPRILKGS
jgi:SAM-dependent methyltransferase